MMVKMNRQLFFELDYTALGLACFEPIIHIYKREQALGNDFTEVYKQLTNGQRALFMFRMYYNHAYKSLANFYWWNAYFLAKYKTWSELKVGLQFFSDDDMLQLLEEMEGVLETRNYPKSLDRFNISFKDDLENDSDLLTFIRPLEATFYEIAPATLKRIGEYIRNNPNEFVQLEE